MVRVWDPQTLQLRFELRDGQAESTAVTFARGSIVAGYGDGYFVAWADDGSEKLASGAVLKWPPVYSVGVHPSGERMVFGGGRGGLTEVIVGPPGDWMAGNMWKDTPPKPIAVNAVARGFLLPRGTRAARRRPRALLRLPPGGPHPCPARSPPTDVKRSFPGAGQFSSSTLSWGN